MHCLSNSSNYYTILDFGQGIFVSRPGLQFCELSFHDVCSTADSSHMAFMLWSVLRALLINANAAGEVVSNA